jgi:transcriptional regulator of acetoin/glycerol metabolism
MTDSGTLNARDFLLVSTAGQSSKSSTLNIEKLEIETIERALKKFNGNLTKAAKELGLGRTTLYRKMEKYGI